MVSNKDSYEYVIEEPLNEENLKRQVELFLEGKLVRHFKSQAIPEESKQGALREVVYNSFEKEVTEAS